jgi:hypothetical protein
MPAKQLRRASEHESANDDQRDLDARGDLDDREELSREKSET